MKQTAVEKMIQYFIEQKKNGASHWCIDDLIAQLHQAKAMEKEQIIESFSYGVINHHDAFKNQNKFGNGEQYYNETFKSE